MSKPWPVAVIATLALAGAGASDSVAAGGTTPPKAPSSSAPGTLPPKQSPRPKRHAHHKRSSRPLAPGGPIPR